MKRILLILFLTATAHAQGLQGRLEQAVWMVWGAESSHQLSPATGDGGRAVGPLQIWAVRVDDCNRICELHHLPWRFTLADRHDLNESVRMFVVSSLHYWPDGTPEQWARHWNGSPTMGPSDPGTVAYWARCQRQLPTMFAKGQ